MHPPMTTATATTTTTTLCPAAHVAPPAAPPPPLTAAFPQHAPPPLLPQYTSSSQLPLLFPSSPPLPSPTTTVLPNITAGLLPSDPTGLPDPWSLSNAVALPGSPITPAAARRAPASSSSPPLCDASADDMHQLAPHPSAYLSLATPPHPHQSCAVPVSVSASVNCGTAVSPNASYYPVVTEAPQIRPPPSLQQSSHCGNNTAQAQSLNSSNSPASIRTVFDAASPPFSSLADRSFLTATPPTSAPAPLHGGRQQRMLPISMSRMPMSPLSPSCTTTTTGTGTTTATTNAGTPFSSCDKPGGLGHLDYTHCRTMTTPPIPPQLQQQQQATTRHHLPPHIQPTPLSSHPKPFSTRPTTPAGAAAQRERETALVRRVHVRVGGAGRLSVYERPADVRAAVLHALAHETALDHSGDESERERARVLQGQLSPLERRVVRTVTNRGAAVRSRMRQRREMVTLRKVVRMRDGRVRQLESIIRALCQAYGVPMPASVKGAGEDEEVEMEELEDDEEEEEEAEEEENGDGDAESGGQGEKTRTTTEALQGPCRKRRRSGKAVGAWNARARLHRPAAQAQAQQQQAW